MYQNSFKGLSLEENDVPHYGIWTIAVTRAMFWQTQSDCAHYIHMIQCPVKLQFIATTFPVSTCGLPISCLSGWFYLKMGLRWLDHPLEMFYTVAFYIRISCSDQMTVVT